jgi:hypothetical protein
MHISQVLTIVTTYRNATGHATPSDHATETSYKPIKTSKSNKSNRTRTTTTSNQSTRTPVSSSQPASGSIAVATGSPDMALVTPVQANRGVVNEISWSLYLVVGICAFVLLF